MSGGGLLNLGSTALQAAYAQLQTTGHNISNVNTPGYTRQTVNLQTAGTLQTGSGFIGRGVAIQTVTRSYDQFLATQVGVAQAGASADAARAEQLTALDTLLGDTSNGLGVAIDDFSASMGDLVNRPFDSNARTVVISRANALAERIRGVADSFAQASQAVEQRLQQNISTLNDQLVRLAGVNNQIASLSASGQPPNDLLDQRDQLLLGVNKILRINTTTNPDGTVNVFSAGGQSLVVGDSVAKFAAQPDALDPSKLSLVLKTVGNDVPVSAAMLGGGSMAGLLRFRDEDLAAASGRLGQLAASIGTALNTQQALGLDPSGAAGAPLFAFPGPQVSAASGNAGSAVLTASVTQGSGLAPSDYAVGYDGTNYTVTRLSDGQQSTVSAWPQTIDGLRLDLSSGMPQAGDRFLVRSASVVAANFSVAMASGARLATGLAVSTQTGAANRGDPAVAAFSVDSVSANLTQPVSISFDGAGHLSVSGTGTGNPTGIAYTPGMSLSYNGWTLQLKGTPAAGDTIQVQPNPSPGTDNRNARAMLALSDARITAGQTFVGAFADLLADVGSRAQGAKSSADLSQTLLNGAQAASSQVGGVNLDEEAARLLQYQQSYQAAAKLMTAAQQMFDTILHAMG